MPDSAPRRLTVMQLLPALNAGGVERSTLEIAQALIDAGHRAVVVSAGGRYVTQLQALGAHHVELDIGAKSLRTLGRVAALRRLMVEQAVDIVHARSRLPAWMGYLAMRGMPETSKPRWVTTAHGLNSPSRYSQIMASGERVICVSESVRAFVLQHYPATDPSRLRVIERGFDPERFRRYSPVEKERACCQWKQVEPRLRCDGPILLLPGRGTRLKGHRDGIELLERIPDATLWLLGAWDSERSEYLQELETFAMELGVADRLVISPPTDRVAQAMAAADVVLQLSRKPEAFGRTVIESLQTGTPVVGWAHGGVGDLLGELYPQGAVEPFDIEQLVSTVTRMLQTPAPLPEVVPYTLQWMQSRTLALYDELIQTPR